MNSLDLHNRLDGINHKLQEFLNNYREMRSERDQLKKENEELRAKLENSAKEFQSFQNKSKIGKLVDDLDEEGLKNTELKNLLDRYIDEIDHCIELMKD